MQAEGSCDLSVRYSFYFILYGDTAVQIIRTLSSSICANDLILASLYIKIMARIERDKCVYDLHNCISVTNKVKINEQNKSIATEPLCLRTEFQAI